MKDLALAQRHRQLEALGNPLQLLDADLQHRRVARQDLRPQAAKTAGFRWRRTRQRERPV